MLSDSRFDHLAGLFTGAALDIDEAALPPEAAEALRTGGAAFGKFVVLSELGRGGASVVYRAWQADLRREVALKVVSGLNPELRARFLREARVCARLSHPGILPVYETGEGGGALWLAMPLVAGRTLDACGLSVDEAAAAVASAARTLDAAHAADIVHRDVKPRNLMRDASGAVLVMDFGLALTREEVTRISVTGQVLGTPSYMAPEQAAGGVADARTDVYGLGATLYRLVCGRAPYEETTLQQFLATIAARDPEPPADAVVPKDLKTILLKSMDRDPARRYPTAAALADDLDRVRRGEPIAGRRAPVAIRAGRAARRHPVAVSVAAAVLLAAAAYGLGSRLSRPRPPAVDQASASRGPEVPEREFADLERARRIAAKGSFDQATAIFQAYANAHPDNPSAWRELGDCHLASGNFMAAAADLGRAEVLRPSDLGFARDRISCLVSAGDLDQAFEALGKALKRFPVCPDLLYLRARIYLARGQPDLALADHGEIIGSNPGNADAWAARAALRVSLGRNAEGAADYDQAIEKGGPSPAWLAGRGRARLKAGDGRGALEDLRAASEADPAGAAALAADVKAAEALAGSKSAPK